MIPLRDAPRRFARACERHPFVCGGTLGVAIVVAWMRWMPADFPVDPVSAIAVATGVITIVIAVRAPKDQDGFE